MEKKYVLAVDQSTQGTKAILFDVNGDLVCRTDLPHRQLINEKGWVSHDLSEIYSNTIQVVKNLVEKVGIQKEEIACLGISNQRETSAAWSRSTGEPLAPAVVWQCSRASEICERIKTNVMIDPDREQKKNGGVAEIIRQKTGMHLSPYFPAAKFAWLQENVEEVKQAKRDNDLCLGTIDTWLLFKLTKGEVYATDYSNASRTMMFNINTLEWDDEILEELDIPKCMLPQVKESSEIYGETDPSFFGGRIPVAGAAGDQQAALFGQACFEKGETKNTYGTGGFLLMNAGDKPVFSNNGLVTTIGWGLNGKITYVLEGSVFVAGAAIQWLRDELHLVDSASDTEYFAGKVPDANGCYVVPAFTGLGAPYWDQYARGTIVGLTRGVNKYHIVRATLESLAYQVNDVLEVMKEDAGSDLAVLRVDGGASANNLLLQIQANISNVAVERPECIETTALGAAYLAGLAVGFWKSKEAVLESRDVERVFRTEIDDEKRNAMVKGWRAAVGCSRDWIKKIQ